MYVFVCLELATLCFYIIFRCSNESHVIDQYCTIGLGEELNIITLSTPYELHVVTLKHNITSVLINQDIM